MHSQARCEAALATTPADKQLLLDLVARGFLTELRRRGIAREMSLKAKVRDQWLETYGFERGLGVAEPEPQPPPP